jgi:hypothetical protein
MKYSKDILTLLRQARIGQVFSVPFFFLLGLLMLCLFFNPSLLGISIQEQNLYYHGKSIWLVMGSIFIALAIFSVVATNISIRWLRHLQWIQENVTPEIMNLSIAINSWSDSTDYTATLSIDAAGQKDWVVNLYRPLWDVKTVQDQLISAKVYFDPKSQQPVVIETAQGFLWAIVNLFPKNR